MLELCYRCVRRLCGNGMLGGRVEFRLGPCRCAGDMVEFRVRPCINRWGRV